MVLCWVLWGFIAAANVGGYVATSYDKRAARLSSRANPPDRIPEKLLWALAAFGGFPAMIYAMHRVRHKTRKKRFLLVFFTAAFVSTIVWAGWLSVTGCLPYELF
ncbi:DUF1294 domain-containing protein [Thermoplasmatales archaeon SW_10_69_26]|nr:MAG: DUF1294 domain-containing protein [Thermoplasmatales archaeon SW_10_69_26]